MSHVALYRKYRPQKFSDVVNQEHIKKTLVNALALDKIAHAYLFSGPRGVGKTTIGRLLAKAVNCTSLNKKMGESCEKCENCQEIASEKSMDIVEIDAASNRGIDEIRELRDKIKYMPSKLSYRVFIIDEVHMLTIEAFNALLKTLEEPPKHIIFILATTEPQKIPATILSRCQRFDFKKITIDDLLEHLKKIAKMESIKISEDALKIIALNSEGSSRDALSLLGQVQSAFDKQEIQEKDIIDLLGLAGANLIIKLAYHIYQNNIKEALINVNDLVMRGFDAGLLLDSLIDFFRNVLLYKNTNNQDLFIAYKDQMDKLQELSSKMENKDIMTLINYLIESKNIQKYSSIPQLPLEMAIIKYIPNKAESLPADLTNNQKNNIHSNFKPKQEIKIKKNSEQLKPTKKIKESNKEIKSVSSIDISAVDTKWAEIVENITKDNYSLGLTLRSSRPLKVSGGNLILECDYSFHKDCIQNSKNKTIVETALNNKIGIPIGIKCIVGKKETVTISNEKEAEEQAEHSNMVNAALDILGGEILEQK